MEPWIIYCDDIVVGHVIKFCRGSKEHSSMDGETTGEHLKRLLIFKKRIHYLDAKYAKNVSMICENLIIKFSAWFAREAIEVCNSAKILHNGKQ